MRDLGPWPRRPSPARVEYGARRLRAEIWRRRCRWWLRGRCACCGLPLAWNGVDSSWLRCHPHGTLHSPRQSLEQEITMQASTSSGTRNYDANMSKMLLEAASCGNYSLFIHEMVNQDPTTLLRKTPQGNNCLHIASIHGHLQFCNDVLRRTEDTLLSDDNFDCETPLVVAITHGHISLASFLLRRCSELGSRGGILKTDRDGCNALHHAIRSGHKDLVLELIEIEPALSQAVSKYNESPMFVAVMRDFTDIFYRMIEIPDATHVGKYGRHALHAAARNGNRVVAKKIMEIRPELATKADDNGVTPIRMAVVYNKVDVLRVLLCHNPFLGYEVNNHGYPLFCSAAARGQVGVAPELLKHCPDALYRVLQDPNQTCLHIAVQKGHPEFVEFIMRTPRLQKLVNMQDNQGKTALHYAIEKCDPKLVAALLSHKNIDTTILDDNGNSAASQLSSITDEDKTLDWKEVHMLMLKADPKDDDISLYNLHKGAKQRETIESRRRMKSLIQKYTSNTSLVAILLTTITFTAAFTLPGGYSSDPASLGHPVMSKQMAFQAFLFFDTLAMCSSFVVAFICLMGRWEDDKFTTYYISVTKKLTWFAYVTTLGAFAAGLFTVLAFQLPFLATWICILVFALPPLTAYIRQWPILKLNSRLGRSCLGPAFNSCFSDMV